MLVERETQTIEHCNMLYCPDDSFQTKVPDGPEMDGFKKLRGEHDKDFVSVHGTIAGSTSIEPIIIDIDDKNIEEMLQNVVENVESENKR